jgi:D-tyrosyl-tRNA(Tyr) deacylase
MAAPPGKAEKLYKKVVETLSKRGHEPQTGRFGAHMKVSLVNDGPVTLLLDSQE